MQITPSIVALLIISLLLLPLPFVQFFYLHLLLFMFSLCYKLPLRSTHSNQCMSPTSPTFSGLRYEPSMCTHTVQGLDTITATLCTTYAVSYNNSAMNMLRRKLTQGLVILGSCEFAVVELHVFAKCCDCFQPMSFSCYFIYLLFT